MSVEIAYDKAQLRSITKSFKAMSDEGIEAAKRESSALAEFLQLKVRETAQRRVVSGAAVQIASYLCPEIHRQESEDSANK